MARLVSRFAFAGTIGVTVARVDFRVPDDPAPCRNATARGAADAPVKLKGEKTGRNIRAPFERMTPVDTDEYVKTN